MPNWLAPMSPPRSPFDRHLGRYAQLEIRRFTKSGAFLSEPAGDENAPTLLLLGPEIPEGAREGDALSVFVYLDSEGRPLATTQAPKLLLGDVAFLKVTAQTKFGAFVDWGLPKELLVPFSEQTVELLVGARHAVGLYLDDTGRLAGTLRVAEMLSERSTQFAQDEWVEGEAWRHQPEIGLFVILERGFVALLPRDEPHTLARGDAARFRISNILPDGKLEVSLRAHAYEERFDDAERILALLGQASTPPVGDRSSPEQIRDVFGLSKKAFKRAAGHLLKQGSVELVEQGYLRLVR